MISLLEIKAHMMQVKVATLASLAILFKAEPEMLRCMMQHWMKKGCVRVCKKEPACGTSCFKCPVQVTEIYEWVYN